jgi:hypothetical protein
VEVTKVKNHASLLLFSSHMMNIAALEVQMM